jgi:hypothetical protein
VKRASGLVDFGDIVAASDGCDGTRSASIGGPVGGALGNAVGEFEFVRRSLAAARDGLCHELINQLVEAGLAAEVFRAGAQTIARAPSGDPKFATLVMGDEPMVRLPLFISANVARYCLPDHRFPPIPHSLSSGKERSESKPMR